MRHLLNIIFWSVIAAAFIGPGTVATAASSGSRFGFTLLWALAFSTVACLVLQEASARVMVVSGRPLAAAIRQRFHGGIFGALVLLAVVGAIIVGCAAYEAGNILGAVAGVSLAVDASPAGVTLVIGAASALLLFLGSTRFVARALGGLVALMGIAFLVTAIRIEPDVAGVLSGALVPRIPAGAGLLVLGLIGTTVVPYNLFLGSGIAEDQRIRDVRVGLAVAIVLGGIISMGILVVGTTVAGEFGFAALAQSLSQELGGWSAMFFAAGLFAAGLSSAITAPLAAAVTARGLFDAGAGRWGERSGRYRAVWALVLAAGVAFGLADVKPIPIIILAQALNGVVLPFVAVFLLLVVNDRSLMGEQTNGAVANVLTGCVVVVAVVLGVSRTASALAAVFGLGAVRESVILTASTVVTVIIAVPVARRILRAQKQTEQSSP
jgi:Mn2+/Fe2+ NRAMP family transporter